jgi:hypothetical protein
MTDKEIRKLKKTELLEMLLDSRKENEELKKQLREANIKLSDKRIMLDKVGSIAEAALHLNGVFEAAQNAADQYLENVKKIVEANPEGDDDNVTEKS